MIRRVLSVIFHRLVRRQVTMVVESWSLDGKHYRVHVCRVIAHGNDLLVYYPNDRALHKLDYADEGVTWAHGADTPAARALIAAEALR